MDLHLLIPVMVPDFGTYLQKHILKLHSFVRVVMQQFSQQSLRAFTKFSRKRFGNAYGLKSEFLAFELVHDFLRAQPVISKQKIQQQRPHIPYDHLFEILICEFASECFRSLILGIPDVDWTNSIRLLIDFGLHQTLQFPYFTTLYKVSRPDILMEISHHSDGVDGLQHLIKYRESLLLRNIHLTHILVESGLVKLRD